MQLGKSINSMVGRVSFVHGVCVLGGALVRVGADGSSLLGVWIMLD